MIGEVRKAGSEPNTRAAAAEFDIVGRTLEGHASVFDVEYPIAGERLTPFVEVVRRGAFRGVGRPVVQAFHGRDAAIGQTPIAELLEAREDSTGLFFRARLFDVPQLDLLREALASASLSGASFRFQVNPGGERWSKNDTYRELTSLSVLELGPCLFGANPAASVKLRRKDFDIEAARRAMNARLRKAGMPEIDRDGKDVKPMTRREMVRAAMPLLLGEPPRRV